MKIACFADQDYYADHLLPIWKKLSPEIRGPFFSRGSATQVKARSPESLQKFKGKVLTASWGNFIHVTKVTGTSHPSMPHGSGGNSSAEGCRLWTEAYKHGKLDFWMTVSKYGEIPGIPHKVINGMPKLDAWVGYRPKTPRKTVAISFRWRETQSAERHYLPKLEAIVTELRSMGWRVIGHGHPLKKDKWRMMWGCLGVEYEPSFDEILKRADVYACDNSGTIWEWAALDRPVVILNCPAYEGLKRIPRFSKFNKVGLHCSGPAELPSLVEDAYREPPGVVAERRRIVRYTHGLMDGNAASRAAKLLEEVYG